jgi:hypothetical protein
MKRFFALFLSVSLLLGIAKAYAEVINFEDLSLNDESYWNGSDESGGFTSNNVFFNNNYDTTWGSWDGFSYSNRTDTEISGLDSQFNAITGGGVNGSSIYAVGYYSTFTIAPPTVTFPTEQEVTGAYFTNTNYAYYSMLNGDDFAKKFEESDWFKLTITGKDEDENVTGSVDVFLAEGTDIVNHWLWLDLSMLGNVKYLEITLSSSDITVINDSVMMNTPAYFCMDNLNANPPSTGKDNYQYPYIFPGFLGIYPLGSYFGTLNNNSRPYSAYLNMSSFGRYFNPYPLAGYHGTSPLIGPGASYSGHYSGLYYIPGSSFNSNSLTGGYLNSNALGSQKNVNFFGNYYGLYSQAGYINPHLIMPLGEYFNSNIFTGYPLFNTWNNYSGNYPFTGFF